VSVRSVKEVAV